MADQNITALPKKTSSQLAATDYLLGIDSAEGYQMLIQDLGDYIIQHATSSLAGSNQTLASAITALNSKLMYTLPNNTDFDTVTTPGIYRLTYGYTYAHAPENFQIATGILMVNTNGTDQHIQILYSARLDSSYIRRRYGATWSAWILQPTRSEVDTLNNSLTYKRCYAETGSSTESFTKACPNPLGETAGVGGILDLIHSEISSYPATTDKGNAVTFIKSNGGALCSGTLYKYNDTFYWGVISSYHHTNEKYGVGGFVSFRHNSDGFKVTYIRQAQF